MRNSLYIYTSKICLWSHCSSLVNYTICYISDGYLALHYNKESICITTLFNNVLSFCVRYGNLRFYYVIQIIRRNV